MRFAVLVTLLVALAGWGTAGAETFRNPILPGFYPDPSVCRVGDDFYLVTSSSEYFPGVPIFHSRDLVHWEQLGHVLDRPSQLDLDGVAPSDGIYAATIRHHQGKFYVITTLVKRKPKDSYTNFLVTASNPAGPWSDPVVLSQTFWRIDPSLFFDDDGRVYYVGNRTIVPPPYDGHRIISSQELDGETLKPKGAVHDLSEGSARQAYAPEGPHIYKKDGTYYLLSAEGGTFETHAVTISRASSVFGPYTLYQGNPILTHRHLGADVDIRGVGHADLVDTARGEWWMVALGMRGTAQQCCNLGRETFLTPVTWNADGWPVVNPGWGRIKARGSAPDLPQFLVPPLPRRDPFAGPTLALPWNFIRTPRAPFYSFSARPGFLQLPPKPDLLHEDGNPAFIGRRIQHSHFVAQTRLDFAPGVVAAAAGIALRNGRHHITWMKAGGDHGERLQLKSHHDNRDDILADLPAPAGPLLLEIACDREIDCTVAFATSPHNWHRLSMRVDGRTLSYKAPGAQFTGAYVGIHATTPPATVPPAADFDWFDYRGN